LKMALVNKSTVSKEAPKETASAVALKETAPVPKTLLAPSAVQPATPTSPKSVPPVAPALQKMPIYTEETVKAQFEGKGYGEKTLAQVVKENNIDMNYINKRLAATNLSTKEGEPMREMGARYNTTFIELIKMILVENAGGK
jgi:hypothetical protein